MTTLLVRFLDNTSTSDVTLFFGDGVRSAADEQSFDVFLLNFKNTNVEPWWLYLTIRLGLGLGLGCNAGTIHIVAFGKAVVKMQLPGRKISN